MDWFFVTALNLLPAGQLDGGHSTFTSWSKSKYLSFAVIISLILMTFYGFRLRSAVYGMGDLCSPYYFLGTYHPPPSEEISNLGKSRTMVGLITGLLLLTTFTPSPIFTVDSPFSLNIDSDENEFFQYAGETNTTSIKIWNNGDEEGWENLSVSINPLENISVSLVVDFVNISSDLTNINSTSNSFQKYVFLTMKIILHF